MKKTALLMLFASNLFASGKFSLAGNYYTKDAKTLPSISVSSFEDTGLGFFVDTYLGTGIAPRHNWPDVYWWVARADAVVPLSENLSIAAGATLRMSEQEWIGVEDESNVHVKLSYRIW